MKRIIAMCLLGLTISTHAQIRLDDVRNESNKQENSENYQPDNNITDEQKQRIKMNNLADIVVMNAAIVGYATACKFNAENIKRVEDYFIKQYSIQNEPLIMAKYRDKVNEFKNKGATGDECRIFIKEFNLILKDISR